MRKLAANLKKKLVDIFTEQVEETKELRTKTPKKPNLKSKFPLQKGDILVMCSGEQYMVQHFTVRGMYHVEQYYLALYGQDKKTATRQKTQSFSTLRMLNYYVKQNRKAIQNIVYTTPRIKEPTMDACHAEALRMEAARQHLRSFLENMEEDEDYI